MGPQKDAASTPHAMCCSEIGSLNSILSPFPCIPQACPELSRRAPFREKRFGKGSWTQLQRFRFPFHLPTHSRENSGSVQTPFQSPSLKSSPLLILLQKNNPFYRPFSTLPLHFAKDYISGKELL